MADPDANLAQLIDSADTEVAEALDAYLPYEASYMAATASAEIPLEGPNTSSFPVATSVACTSAR